MAERQAAHHHGAAVRHTLNDFMIQVDELEASGRIGSRLATRLRSEALSVEEVVIKAPAGGKD